MHQLASFQYLRDKWFERLVVELISADGGPPLMNSLEVFGGRPLCETRSPIWSHTLVGSHKSPLEMTMCPRVKVSWTRNYTLTASGDSAASLF
jgi:hypothetical protein